jgi:hypothetical protein
MGPSWRAWIFGLLALVLARHGVGAPTEAADDTCGCEAAEALASTDAAGAHDDCGDEEAGETCPPDCDDCDCCSVAPMFATTTAPRVGVVGVRPAPVIRRVEPRAPPVENDGVFRPPRA